MEISVEKVMVSLGSLVGKRLTVRGLVTVKAISSSKSRFSEMPALIYLIDEQQADPFDCSTGIMLDVADPISVMLDNEITPLAGSTIVFSNRADVIGKLVLDEQRDALCKFALKDIEKVIVYQEDPETDVISAIELRLP